MKNLSGLSDCSVYPGVYVPFKGGSEVLHQLKRLKKQSVAHPTVNISELPDSFKIEMIIPGMKRDEIMIDARDHKLFVYGTHKHQDTTGELTGVLGAFDRHIKLPRNGDIEFASAEYKSGILCICFLKTDKPNRSLNTRIVVY